jgi:hypothetical protein
LASSVAARRAVSPQPSVNRRVIAPQACVAAHTAECSAGRRHRPANISRLRRRRRDRWHGANVAAGPHACGRDGLFASLAAIGRCRTKPLIHALCRFMTPSRCAMPAVYCARCGNLALNSIDRRSPRAPDGLSRVLEADGTPWLWCSRRAIRLGARDRTDRC